jgi:hypothetical protein
MSSVSFLQVRLNVKQLRSFLLFCLDYSGYARWPKLY